MECFICTQCGMQYRGDSLADALVFRRKPITRATIASSGLLGKRQHHPIDDAPQALYQLAMCGGGNAP